MKKLVVLFIVGLVVGGCSNEQAIKKDALFKEVMAAHDEVMPKMGDMNRLAKSLTAKADSLSQMTDQDYSAQVANLRQAAKNVEEANEGMMQWMRQFEMPDNESPIAEVITYLSEQKEKIDKVKEDILQALKEGSALL